MNVTWYLKENKMKKKHKKHKTPLQEWASERCYINKGKLIGVKQSIRTIAAAKSTLDFECCGLMIAYNLVDRILSSWDRDDIRNQSRTTFLREV